ncbi:MAG: ATP-binding cassette domain-containing protein [Pseudonocardia sp.]|nr:ATP-binding cassette domain-containing protein [Pseudonocardia sp.]
MIHTEALTRSFTVGKETIEAVRGVDLDVAEGELVAFLGPNGAGKSTTLRMLTSLLPPTSGRARVAGLDVAENPAEVRRRIGYIGQKDGAGHSYRVWDELLMQGRFYGMSKADATASGESLLETLDLGSMKMRKVSSLSGGQKRRLDIALGLVHTPRLLFLDEPSTGMDPQNRANLWEHISRIRAERGTTIVLTTHYLDEADTMAERVVIIDHGRIIADDTADALKAKQAGDRLTVVVRPEQVGAARTALAAEGGDLDGGEPAERPGPDGIALSIRVEAASHAMPGVLDRLRIAGIDVVAASARQPTLDDVFLNLTGRSLREGEA